MLRGSLGQEVKVYLVGGAVRDLMLGLDPKDRDYVVVGATPELMIENGFQQVGADFPVFLHPETGEEYALARTERKTGKGYNGFTTDHSRTVTLRDDLERRDLTVNAMAMTENDQLIDYFDGMSDLRNGILRHVGPAFAEDPVRVLRVARFAARYGWRVAAETMDLMRAMVNAGELDHLTRERVWKEFEKGFSEKSPSTMLEILYNVGFFNLKAYDGLNVHRIDRFWAADGDGLSLETKLCMTFRMCNDLEDRSFPSEICDTVKVFRRIRDDAGRYEKMNPRDRLGLFQKADALRRTDTFRNALDAARVLDDVPFDRIMSDALALKAFKLGDRLPKDAKPNEIPTHVERLRVELLTERM